MLKVEFLGPLRAIVGKKFVEIPVEGKMKLSDLLTGLDKDIRKYVVDDFGKPVAGVLVLVNGVDVRYLSWLDTEISETDTVTLIPSIHGGRV
ncbi:MAG: MoaD/ThiS family protein [Candidatus Caldarchaeum sp.]